MPIDSQAGRVVERPIINVPIINFRSQIINRVSYPNRSGSQRNPVVRMRWISAG